MKRKIFDFFFRWFLGFAELADGILNIVSFGFARSHISLKLAAFMCKKRIKWNEHGGPK